jgi:hypothetical protein
MYDVLFCDEIDQDFDRLILYRAKYLQYRENATSKRFQAEEFWNFWKKNFTVARITHLLIYFAQQCFLWVFVLILEMNSVRGG